MRALHPETPNNRIFILALSQFIERRGHIKITTFNIGSNFAGGEYELRALVRILTTKG